MINTSRVVLAQINPIVGDIAYNVRLLINSLQRARDEFSADLIIFPELALTGYSPEDWLLRKDFAGAVAKGLQQLIEASAGIAVIVGYPHYEDDFCYNALGFIEHKQLIAHYHKQALPNYGVFDEQRYFQSGHKPCIINWRGLQLSVLICEDVWHKTPVQQLIGKNFDAIIVINASPFDMHKAEHREKLVMQVAEETKRPLFYVNLVGGQDELIFDGGSLVVNAQGSISSQAAFYQPQLLLVECQQNNHQLIPEVTAIAPLPAIESRIYQALILALRDFIEKNNFPGVLLGLSGGIDSALTLAIAVDALGANKVHAVFMPSRYSADISGQEAKAQATALGVQYDELTIEKIYQSYLDTLAPLFAGLPANIAEENLQARIRGALLMAISNKTGKLVVTTGNKSEMATGYATLYGDMCGGFAVLKDIYKTMVYRLAHYRNNLSTTPVIPERVIARAPSAELAPMQRDEDTLPPYLILDSILYRIIEQKQAYSELVAAGFAPDTVKQVMSLLHRSEFKRWQSAVGPKVTTCAFGRDWRFPLRALKEVD